MNKIHKLDIGDSYLIENSSFTDKRGSFNIFFEEKNYIKFLNKNITKIYFSRNLKKGTLRGLHFQTPPYSEVKIIKCIKGAIFDIFVDLRKNSPTFMKKVSINLSENDNYQLIVPSGCAHGFQTLKDNSDVLYLTDNEYVKKNEGGIKYDDPLINVDWPHDITCISDRDENFEYLNKNYEGMVDF